MGSGPVPWGCLSPVCRLYHGTGSTGNVLSFSETRAHQAVQQKAEQFMLYNQRQLTRVYPSAYRIDSSNFNPVPYWNVGCQLGRSCMKDFLPFWCVCAK